MSPLPWMCSLCSRVADGSNGPVLNSRRAGITLGRVNGRVEDDGIVGILGRAENSCRRPLSFVGEAAGLRRRDPGLQGHRLAQEEIVPLLQVLLVQEGRPQRRPSLLQRRRQRARPVLQHRRQDEQQEHPRLAPQVVEVLPRRVLRRGA